MGDPVNKGTLNTNYIPTKEGLGWTHDENMVISWCFLSNDKWVGVHQRQILYINLAEDVIACRDWGIGDNEDYKSGHEIRVTNY